MRMQSPTAALAIPTRTLTVAPVRTPNEAPPSRVHWLSLIPYEVETLAPPTTATMLALPGLVRPASRRACASTAALPSLGITPVSSKYESPALVAQIMHAPAVTPMSAAQDFVAPFVVVPSTQEASVAKGSSIAAVPPGAPEEDADEADEPEAPDDVPEDEPPEAEGEDGSPEAPEDDSPDEDPPPEDDVLDAEPLPDDDEPPPVVTRSSTSSASAPVIALQPSVIISDIEPTTDAAPALRTLTR